MLRVMDILSALFVLQQSGFELIDDGQQGIDISCIVRPHLALGKLEYQRLHLKVEFRTDFNTGSFTHILKGGLNGT